MTEIKYDSDGYNKDGYNKDGFDREGYDRDGFDWNDFNKKGINFFTGTKFDPEGYDVKKRDKNGFDIRGMHYKNLYGFNRYGIHEATGTKHDPSGFDINGSNRDGFLRNKIHRITNSQYDPDGYDFFGCNNKGINRQGASEEIQEATFDPHRLGTDGEVPNGSSIGFDQNGIHHITGTKYDPSGLDVNGIDKNGLDREGFYENGLDVDGFDRNEIHHITGTKYDPSGLDVNRVDISGSRRDKRGFNKKGVHWKTGTKFDVEGYDQNGFDPLGYKVCGYDKEGYDKKGFNKRGYDKEGYDNKGFNKRGYDRKGYDNEGFRSNGFSAAGIHKLTHTKYAPDGYDINGRDIKGFNKYGVDSEGFRIDGFHWINNVDRDGYDRAGLNNKGFDRQGFDKYGFDKEGYDKKGFDRQGFNRQNFDKFGRHINHIRAFYNNTFLHHSPYDAICSFLGLECTEDYRKQSYQIKPNIIQLRENLDNPVGKNVNYYQTIGNRSAYLLSYFSYYIEPIYYALIAANKQIVRPNQTSFNVAFLGGGPCPELLGLIAYLGTVAPQIKEIRATIFDRQTSWNDVHRELLDYMVGDYSARGVSVKLQLHNCNFLRCDGECGCNALFADMIVSQNFLTEIAHQSSEAVKAFTSLTLNSNCKFVVFVDNNFPAAKNIMNKISSALYESGITADPLEANYKEIKPHFQLPSLLTQFIFTGEDRLIAKKYVKFNHMVLEIER